MQKVLIANRGEIACRIIRSCRSLGLRTVAVYSEADANSLHVDLADESLPLALPNPKQSYLSVDAILSAARVSEADAVHPGYGFLSENPAFAQAVLDAGLVWIGPDPVSISRMGDKEQARLLAGSLGLPLAAGSARFDARNLFDVEKAAASIGFPLLVKATAGGGGIGMRRVDAPADLQCVVAATQGMAAKTFGDGTVYLERFITKARHVEVQIFGFGDGRAVHMFERECSIQRRYQKIIEESPAPQLAAETRSAMIQAALTLAESERYRGAGTVEFVLDVETGSFYFLEMNTRIQVEHPVTEMSTGLDLVAMQIRLAAGDTSLEGSQATIETRQHAIECRIYAECPEKNFLPSPGQLLQFEMPRTDSKLRVDTGVRKGDRISHYYDPMIAKVIAAGSTRQAAIDQMRAALGDVSIEGVSTNIPFLRRVLAHPTFRAGDIFTGFINEHPDLLQMVPI